MALVALVTESCGILILTSSSQTAALRYCKVALLAVSGLLSSFCKGNAQVCTKDPLKRTVFKSADQDGRILRKCSERR